MLRYTHMKSIVIIPTYNERENLARLIPKIMNQKIPNLDILVVDDNSPDGTAEVVLDWQKIYNHNLHLIRRQGKMGLGSAYIAGFQKALELGADLIIEMDADFSHEPADLPRLIKACSEADLAIGSRKIDGGQIVGWNWRRKIMSNGAMYVSRKLLKLKTQDVTAGFRCFKKEVLETINISTIKSAGYAFQEELLYRVDKSGFKIVEIPVKFIDRKIGKSKLGLKEILEFFLLLFKITFKKYRF